MKQYLTFIILGLFLSCSEEEPEPQLVKIDYEYVVLDCIFLEDAQYIIETEEEYFQMATQGNCWDTINVPLDLNEYVLIGKFTKTDVNDQKELNIYKNSTLKKIIYKLDLEYVPGPINTGGFGNIYSYGINWVKIPKPPEDYIITIEYNEY